MLNSFFAPTTRRPVVGFVSLVLLLVSFGQHAFTLDVDDTYDYIIVGAGTSGLVVANRLSELPDVKVLVIEAGASVYSNPNVTEPDVFGLGLGTSIDWLYNSSSQAYVGGRVISLSAGKAIGGTSTINGGCLQIGRWSRVLRVQQG